MKHIIDTEQIDKLPKYGNDGFDNITRNENGWLVYVDDLRTLIANSPQADDVPPDVYDIVVDTGDGIYHTAEVVHFQQSGSKRMIQVRFGDTQADDVRKDSLYQELIMAVGNKYPNETRHQTALRYIVERENRHTGEASQATR